MAAVTGPGVFANLRDQSRADYHSALGPYHTWLGLLLLLLLNLLLPIIFNIIDISIGNHTLHDRVLDIVKPFGITDYSRALIIVIGALMCVAGSILGLYWLCWGQLVLIAQWQRRYTWRILNETSLLWFYIMSDRISGAPPIPEHWWYRFKEVVGLAPKRRQAGPGTVEASLTRLILHFDAECRGVRQRGIPAWQIALQWLIVILPVALLAIATLITYYCLQNQIASNPAQAHAIITTYFRSYSLVTYPFMLWLWLSIEAAAGAIPAARRIGIRLALVHYFTTDELAAGLPRGLPVELKPLR